MAGESTTETWEPGTALRVVSRRLLLRSLTASDLHPGDLERWAGSGERTEHVWKPDCALIDYFRGLVRVADGRRFFLVGIFLRKSSRLIGYWKAQVDPTTQFLIPTTVIGDEAYAGYSLGAEAARAVQQVLLERLPLAGISSRIYADNDVSRRILPRHGYAQVQSYSERAQNGAEREVLVFVAKRDEWLARSESVLASLASCPDPEPDV